MSGDLFGRLLAICLLRRGPQDLPASGALLGGLVLLLGALSYWSLAQMASVDRPLLHVGLGIGLALGFLALVLGVGGRGHRWLQSASAMLGSELLFSLLALPLVLTEPAGGGAALALLGVWLWSLLVLAHILRHALELALPAGLLLALGYAFTAVSLGALIQA